MQTAKRIERASWLSFLSIQSVAWSESTSCLSFLATSFSFFSCFSPVFLLLLLLFEDGEQSRVSLHHGAIDGQEQWKRARMVVGRIGIKHLAVSQATGKEVSQRRLSSYRAQRNSLPESSVDQRHFSRCPDRAAGATLPRFFILDDHIVDVWWSFVWTTTSSLSLHGFISTQSGFLFILSR